MTKSLRALVLMHSDLVPPEKIEGHEDRDINLWKTEYDVVTTLRDIGHSVLPLGVSSDLGVIRSAIEEFEPHIAFNLLEEFHGVALYDQHVVSYLELMRQPYTGCNPRGLTLAHDKALSKKVLAFHRIPAPRFKVFPMGRRPVRAGPLRFPVFVKSLTEDASLGISQASLVTSEEKLRERVAFVHEKLGTDAIAEQYIDGRELYVGVLGNRRLQTLPIWELTFGKLPDGSSPIATAKVKHDLEYQKQIGVEIGPARELGEGVAEKIARLCKRAYRSLELTGYARMDLRLAPDGGVFLIEANPNPELAFDEEFSESAKHGGLDYHDLLQRILHLGLRYRAHWRA